MLPDLRRRHLLIAIDQHGGAGENLQAANFGKLGNDVLGNSVAEVFVFFHAADIFEIEHGDRALELLAGGSRCAAVRHAAVPGLEIALQARQVRL